MNYSKEHTPTLLIKRPSFAESRIFPWLAQATFFLYIFFVYFGTSMPFGEKIKDVEDIATSNVINQIVFSALFITAAISLIPKLKHLGNIMMKEKFLSLLLFWGLLSVLWSDFPFVSFKRWFQVFTTYIIAVAVLLHIESLDDLISVFKTILAGYILVSVASVFAIPEATDFNGSWRGLAPSKNHLGQASLISALVWFYAFKNDSLKWKPFSLVMFLLSLLLLGGSLSGTSIITFLFLAVAAGALMVDEQLKNLSLGRLFSVTVIVIAAAFFLTASIYAPDIVEYIFSSAGKDTSFTGRTDLWADILNEFEKHPWIGAGFQGFWVVENENLLMLYEIYLWLPNQAHNGYLDILNELGIVGILIFLTLIAYYFINLPKVQSGHFWKWIFIAGLMINVQESTFIRPQLIVGVMFIIAYLVLFTDLYRNEIVEYREDGRID